MSWAIDMRSAVAKIRETGIAVGSREGTSEMGAVLASLAVIAGASLLLVEALVEIRGELEELNARESQRP